MHLFKSLLVARPGVCVCVHAHGFVVCLRAEGGVIGPDIRGLGQRDSGSKQARAGGGPLRKWQQTGFRR